MDTNDRRRHLDSITDRIIACAYTVANTLGHGFLEKVYENALAREIRKVGLQVQQQCPLKVYYDGVIVGDYAADLLVEGSVIVELKAVRAVDDVQTAQCLNYLKAARLSVCLLINFGKPKIDVRRIVSNF